MLSLRLWIWQQFELLVFSAETERFSRQSTSPLRPSNTLQNTLQNFTYMGATISEIAGAIDPPPLPLPPEKGVGTKRLCKGTAKVQYIIIQAILSRKSMSCYRWQYSMSIRLLTVKNNSHADMRTSHTQLLGKGCQHGKEDFKNKILS